MRSKRGMRHISRHAHLFATEPETQKGATQQNAALPVLCHIKSARAADLVVTVFPS